MFFEISDAQQHPKFYNHQCYVVITICLIHENQSFDKYSFIQITDIFAHKKVI
jgi:hypothetical protein